jgi:hypothetical protein
VKDWIDANAGWLHYGMPIAAAIAVVAMGKWIAHRMEVDDDMQPIVDLAVVDQPPRDRVAKC